MSTEDIARNIASERKNPSHQEEDNPEPYGEQQDSGWLRTEWTGRNKRYEGRHKRIGRGRVESYRERLPYTPKWEATC